jgi:hypothetical protein
MHEFADDLNCVSCGRNLDNCPGMTLNHKEVGALCYDCLGPYEEGLIDFDGYYGDDE